MFQYYLFERLEVIVGPFCSDNRPQVYVTCKYQMDKFGYGYCSSVCAICLEEYERKDKCAMLHECRHTFHHECLRKWLAKKTSCPLCRRRLYTNIENSMVLETVTPF
ncbi:hypothetical protein M0R45_013154 [Rubus argutus]|uniref:RING-type E3 ubiquitin transferase n=1 Tax=Rubus argutus TaxID=59490 RepID=A0AAW1XIZ8_RUBAR